MAGRPSIGNQRKTLKRKLDMQSFRARRSLTLALALLQIVLQLTLTLPAAHAQSLDSSPPVIDSRTVEEGFRGENQVFTATVTDDREVASVILHYRLNGETVYQNRVMEPIGSSGIYSTTLTTSNESQAIQYYIEATDVAQNRTLQGFAFDPMERRLLERAQPVSQAPVAEPIEQPSGMSTGRKVLYGAIGLLVVGALASASGGSGSSSEASDPGVDVTIVVEPLQ